MSDKIREAFEAKFTGNIEKNTATARVDTDGAAFYAQLPTRLAWEQWRAAWHAALAQQPAPVAVPDALDEYRQFEKWRQNWNGKWPRPADPGEWEAWQARARLATPAAPVAVGQEPVAWIVVDEPFHGTQGIEAGEWDVEFDHKAINEMACANSPGRFALYAAPPAAEQPDTVKVSRELLGLIAYALHGPGWFVLHRKVRVLLAGGDKP